MLKFNKRELNLLYEGLITLNSIKSSEEKGDIDTVINKIIETGKIDKKSINESLNEYHQLLDKVKYNQERGFIIGEIEGKMIVQVQGNTYLVDPNDLQEYHKKPDLTVKPPMKFDEETLALLFEQYVKCGVYHGNVPIRLNDCYVKYNQWEKAEPNQQIKILIEGNSTFIPKSQVKILENINDFANEENYIPGVLVDEATEEALQNILLNAIDFSNAIGDADPVRIIIETPEGEKELQTVPVSAVRTMSV